MASGDSTNALTETVDQETKVVFQSFVSEKFKSDDTCEVDSLLIFPDLNTTHNTSLTLVGRQLARIGDDVNERYKEQFERIANELNMSNDTIYEKFSKIVQSMLLQEANWGRILTLFCFGYYLARRFVRDSFFGDVFTRIQNCVIQFVRNNIAQWIISQGGWLQVAAQNLRSEQPRYFYALSAISGLSLILIAVYWLRKKN